MPRKLKKKKEEINKIDYKIEHKYRDLEEILKPFSLVYRDEWDDGRYPSQDTSGEDLITAPTEVSTAVMPPLKHPIPAVLFSYTQTPVCGKFEECQRFLKAMCRESLRKGMPDIPYNFAVGGDGTVYELRGWLKKPEISNKYPQLDGVVIEVAHFGYPGRPPPLAMANAAWELVQYGVKIAFLSFKVQFHTDYHPMVKMVLHFTEECIVKRSEWGAKDATGPLDVLTLPVSEVLLTYTGTNPCSTSEECHEFARDLQAEYQKHNIRDIGPNFMIGGDGLVYEGRGWNFAPEQHPCAPQLHGKALEISHFGTKGDYPPKYSAFLAWDLITLGIKKRKIEQVPEYTACYDWEALDPIIYHKSNSKPKAPTQTQPNSKAPETENQQIEAE